VESASEREIISITRRQFVDEHKVSGSSVSRVCITILQCQLFVLRTHYEYAADEVAPEVTASTADATSADHGSAASDSSDEAATVVENLHGLCKLQPHALNFKTLRCAARADAFSPVVAVLGPTASGKSAIVREFKPTT
jgi:hypothetical protein